MKYTVLMWECRKGRSHVTSITTYLTIVPWIVGEEQGTITVHASISN